MSRKSDEGYEFGPVEVTRVTEKAICVCDLEGSTLEQLDEVWIPRSQIHCRTDTFQEDISPGDQLELWISTWFADACQERGEW